MTDRRDRPADDQPTDDLPTDLTGRLLPTAPGRAVAAHLWRMLRGRRLRLAGVLLLFLAESATAVVFPLVIGSLVDTVIAGAGDGVPGVFWWQLTALAGTATAAGLLTWAGAVAVARLAETVIAELREDYVTAALGLPRATVETAGVGDVVTRASDDIAEVSGTLPETLPRVAVSTFTVVLVAAGFGALDLRYLAAFALTLPLYALTARWYLRTAPAVYAAERSARSERGQHILGALTQLPTVAAHHLERRQLGRVQAASWQTVRWAMRTRVVQNRLFGRLNLTEAVGVSAVLAVGIWLAFTGSATTGEVTAAALLFLRAVAPIAALLSVMDDLQAATAALGRLVGVITLRTPRPSPPTETAEPPDPDPDLAVAVDRVSFSYDGRNTVLSEVSLRVGLRETVALVGATGSGKSTLAGLIAGVHEPDTGRVVRRVPHERVVTVPQEPYLFAATVRDNLTLACPEASDTHLDGVLRGTGAAPLVRRLPDTLDTRVGHGGHPATPGHAQHLALARAALADPSVMVLDEATAEADSADQAALDHAAREVTAGRAALIIAHRLSQAAAADRIVVVEAGRVVEDGTHDELLAADGAYAGLWRSWQAGRGSAVPE